MRKLVITTIISVQVMFLSGCAAAWQNRSYSDDLYSVHDKKALAERESKSTQVKQSDSGYFNGYNAVLADSYESAYARRLYDFSSPTYRMPSSYYSWRYSDAFHYASAYDPAFYNVVVSGDMVWVEPKYITSMFGSWGATVIPSYGWYYGWNDPFYYWNSSYRYGWYCGWGWNSPYYWGWGYPYYPYHHYPHHYPHHHPPYAGSGSVGSTGHHQIHRPSTVGRNPGAATPADRGGYTRPSSSSAERSSQPTYRGGNSSSGRNEGNSSYRSSGSSSYRSSGSSSVSRSYTSGSSSSSHSSYSGGGNSRGR